MYVAAVDRNAPSYLATFNILRVLIYEGMLGINVVHEDLDEQEVPVCKTCLPTQVPQMPMKGYSKKQVVIDPLVFTAFSC